MGQVCAPRPPFDLTDLKLVCDCVFLGGCCEDGSVNCRIKSSTEILDLIRGVWVNSGGRGVALCLSYSLSCFLSVAPPHHHNCGIIDKDPSSSSHLLLSVHYYLINIIFFFSCWVSVTTEADVTRTLLSVFVTFFSLIPYIVCAAMLEDICF